MADIHTPYGMKEEFREHLKKVGIEVESEFDDDFVLEIRVVETNNTFIEADTCKFGAHVEISEDLVHLPAEQLARAISCVMEQANSGIPVSLPHDAMLSIYNDLWKKVDRSQIPHARWGVMRKDLRDALRLLKDRGLLDDLPEGTVFTSSQWEMSVPHRVIAIPIDYRSDEELTVQSLAMMLYMDVFVKHIVTNTMYGYDVDAPEDVLMKDQMGYASTVIKDETTADGE